MQCATNTFESLYEVKQMMIIEKLRVLPPLQVALALEKEGWKREWACRAVNQLEVLRNPAGLRDGHVPNQKMREQLSLRAGVGAGLFILGSAVSLVTVVNAFSSGGFLIVTYGAIISGAMMWRKSYPQLKFYPDRRLPVYTPPKDPRDHRPEEY